MTGFCRASESCPEHVFRYRARRTLACRDLFVTARRFLAEVGEVLMLNDAAASRPRDDQCAHGADLSLDITMSLSVVRVSPPATVPPDKAATVTEAERPMGTAVRLSRDERAECQRSKRTHPDVPTIRANAPMHARPAFALLPR